MEQCKLAEKENRFVLEVTCIPEPMAVLATDQQLSVGEEGAGTGLRITVPLMVQAVYGRGFLQWCSERDS